MKTNPQHSVSPITFDNLRNGLGLTKREYFAAMVDVPWNAVLDTLNLKFPQKKGEFTLQEFVECSATIKVMQADALIKALNETQP